jgi:hypothetical protein
MKAMNSWSVVQSTLELFVPPKAGESTEYNDLCNANQKLHSDFMTLRKKSKALEVNILQMQQQCSDMEANSELNDADTVERKKKLEDTIESYSDAFNKASQESERALKDCTNHSQTSRLFHLNSLKKA